MTAKTLIAESMSEHTRWMVKEVREQTRLSTLAALVGQIGDGSRDGSLQTVEDVKRLVLREIVRATDG